MNPIYHYKGKTYPFYLKNGNHCKYILPVAKEVCVGKGVDIGANRKEWAFPGAKMVDSTQNPPWNDAMKLHYRSRSLDYVFSSHCLEHLSDYVGALMEWKRVLRQGGCLFLYLPSADCEYWRPMNNRKHIHIFTSDQIHKDLIDLGFKNCFASGVDLAYSFAVFAFRGS